MNSKREWFFIKSWRVNKTKTISGKLSAFLGAVRARDPVGLLESLGKY